MEIRLATVADVERCQRFDGTYDTDYVWQVEEQVARDQITVRLQRVRLPRRTEVIYPRLAESLYADLERKECFLVADDHGLPVGYIDMIVQPGQWRCWVEQMLVHQPYRRQGVATQLVQSARRWALQYDLRSVAVAVQNKNDPAIHLLAKLGFTFCGFVDRYYANGDVGIIYMLQS